MKIFLIIIWLFSIHIKGEEIQSVLFHPIFDRYYSCAEHHYGQYKSFGDALGTDCFVVTSEKIKGRNWLRKYRNDGHKNEDWYSWRKNVLSPIEGKITRVNINKVVNEPGIIGKGVSSYIIIQNEDGLNAMLAHIREPKVKVGDKVKKGQAIALVGNNGQSWHPHIHIGAWKKKRPLQIRFDQKKIKNR